MLSPTTESVIDFLVQVFVWPALFARNPGHQLMLFVILWFVLIPGALIAKRFEMTSDFAYLSKRVLLVAMWAFYGIWFPIAAVLAIP